MEDSRSKMALTDSEMEDKCVRSITKQLSGPMKPNLLLPPPSSKPPLGPVPLLLKNPNNSPSLIFPAIEALTVNSEQAADKNEVQRQTPDEFSAHQNNVETSDARKLKRVMSNRLSAHRSRLRKLEHVANLERQCAELQNQISHLHPQIEAFANLKNMLMLEQNVLTQSVQALQNQTYVKQAEIATNQAEVYELREIEKRQKEVEAQATMAFANWDTLPNDNQQIMLNVNIPAQGFENIEGGTSGMEVDDEQTMNTNISSSVNELDATVNRPKLDDNVANSEFQFYF